MEALERLKDSGWDQVWTRTDRPFKRGPFTCTLMRNDRTGDEIVIASLGKHVAGIWPRSETCL